ncbi:MAG TPA: hypothetical protein VEC37_12930, partial [Bacillota bacterium]|nr:hypothetical protein [Bacillota bacterium]
LHIRIFRHALDHSKDSEVKQLTIIPGTPIKNYLQTCLIPLDWQVYYSSPTKAIGKVLDEVEINSFEPVAGDSLVIMPAIQGGDSKGKNILTTVASIGIMMLSAGAGALVASSYGVGSFWSYAAAIGVQVAGGLVLNHFNKPKSTETNSTTYNWGNISSTTGEGNSVPLTFGTVRTGGQLLTAHVSYDGEKQYLNLLFSGGEGPCDYIGNGEDLNCTGIKNITINGNPIENYRDVEVYKRAGLNNQSVIPNFNDTFADKSVNTELVLNDNWTTVTTDSNATQGLEIIFECPAGLYATNNNGGYDTASVRIQMEYKLSSTATWTSFNSNIQLDGATSKAVRGKYRIDNLTQGRYDVRAKCIYKSGTSNQFMTTVYFKTLSSIGYEDFSYPNLILLGIKALASDQLNGGMPTVTWEQTRSKGWVYNPITATYEQKPLNIPAWAAYDLISRVKKYCNISNGQMETVVEGIGVNRMDYDAFLEAAEYQSEIINGCQRCKCNYLLDTTETLWDALKDIEQVGRFKVISRGTK